MRCLVLILMLIPFTHAVASDKGDDFNACQKGRSEIARKASDYHGDDRIKRLIKADLTRAGKEEAEGDADECLEALDHATKLLAGQY